MFLRAGERRLEFREIAGSAERPPLVFLHDGLGCVSTWRDFPDVVAMRTGCSALLYSRWGHGASEPLPSPRGIRFMHDEADRVLPEVLDDFELHAPVLIGHSDGASIALIHAGRGRRPVRGLVLIAPHVFVEDCSIASITSVRDEFESDGDFRERMWKHHGDNMDGAFHGWSDVWLDPAFRSWNLEELLPSITCPVLIVQGEDDQFGTRRQVDAIASQVRGDVEVLMLPDCGHAPHRDQRDAVVERTCAFIGRFL